MSNKMNKLLSAALALSMVTGMLPATAMAAAGDQFPDLPKPGHWSHNAMVSAVENGLLSGVDGMLLPTAQMTRAQMATIINHAFGAVDKADVSGFTDMKQGAWYYDQIARAVKMGALSGVGGTLMAPDAPLSREQAFTILVNVFKLEKADPAVLNQFSDKNQLSSFAVAPAAAMVKAGYVTGDGSKLMPKATLTREELAQMLYNMLGSYISKAGTYSENIKGNVMVNASGAVLKDMKVDGDLIIGEGVGTGTVTLDNVVVTGRIVIRGGSVVKVVNGTSASSVVTGKTGSGSLTLDVEKGSKPGQVTVTDGADQTILTGSYDRVVVDADTEVVLKDADVKDLTIRAEDAVVKTEGKTTVDKVTVDKEAVGAELQVNSGSHVNKVETNADKVVISGSGKVDQAVVKGDNTAVNTPGTNVSVAEGVTGTTANGKDVKPSKPSGGSSSGGSSGGGSVTPDKPDVPVTSPDEAKIKAAITAIKPEDGFKLVEKKSECTTNHKNGEHVGSHPFSSMYCSVGEIDKLAAEHGFGEKEFFMTGKANVYGLAENGVNVPVIKTEGADYTTRLLIHYPENAEKFSGRVYVDILNASAGYDLEDIFRRSYEHFMENGDIYIGITSKTITAQALKNFDPVRYADIDWLVNNDDEKSAEVGLVWDMLSQLGTVLKERPEDLLGADLGAKVKEKGRTYLMGQSQSGFYLQTYLSVFYPYINNVLNGKDIFDGYFNAVGSSPTALANGVRVKNVGFPKTEEPYIVMMGEGEATNRRYEQQTDKSEQDWKFRLYEVAGAPHADPTSPIIPNNFEIAKANAKTDKQGNYVGTSRDTKKYTGNHVEGDLHLNEFVTGALVNLDEWARNGKPAPSADDHWLQFDEGSKQPAKDQCGNVLGGLRSPKIDAPLATYYGVINGGSFATEGSMIHMTKDQLDARYEGATQNEKFADYKAEFKASADAALADRYITQRDHDKLIAWSESTSAFDQKAEEVLKSQTDISALNVEQQNVTSDKILNSTVNSVGCKDAEWNDKAPVWVPALKANDDGTIQYVNKSGEQDKLSMKYSEKEYFISGSANLYDIASDNRLMVREDDLPYTNRILVRTPADPEQFNGKVYVDILNASDKYDNEALWRRAYGMIMEEGAAYVGITSKPVCIAALKRADEHYSKLSWDSPNSFLYSPYKINKAAGQTAEEAYEQFWVNAGELPYTDVGLVWDILSQAGYAIKANKADMFGAGKSVDKVYLYGQSQSGFVMNGYFYFMDLLKANQKALPYDGFMNVVGTYPPNKINQSDTSAAKGKGDESLYIGGELGVPVMYVTSQTDFNPKFRPASGKNVDEEKMFALYEIAGAPHSDPAAPVFPNNSQLVEMGYKPRNLFPDSFDQGQVISDYNSNMFVQALLEQLDKWAVDGTKPVEAPFLTVGEDASKPEGGLRSPQIDAPLAHYYSKPIGSFFSTTGTMVPFTAEELEAAYPGGFADYKAKFTAALDKLVEAGLVRATDRGYMMKYCEANAKLFEASAEQKDVAEMMDLVPAQQNAETAMMDLVPAQQAEG